jgi:AraC-like DNA-binding protein
LFSANLPADGQAWFDPPSSRSSGRPSFDPGVVGYIEEHLDTSLPLGHMAAVARLSSYSFAREFKAANGLPPHQYVVACRVESAKQLVQGQTCTSGGGRATSWTGTCKEKLPTNRDAACR